MPYANLGTKPFHKGLQDLGNGTYAWLQPDGGWGWSNAGLVVDSGESVLVDTLFDLKLTREMLAAMSRVEPQATREYSALINTHSNGDHCNGNELVPTSRIVASTATAQELMADSPERLASIMRNTEALGEVGAFFKYCFAAFDFENITPTRPNKTFDDEMSLEVGSKSLHLKRVGPCHTGGDILVHVPADRLMYTGDILFVEGHPIIWVGPVSNWIQACDYMLDLDLEIIVPGHGPITDKRGVGAVRAYLTYIRDESKKLFDSGLSIREAALEIALDDFESWGDAERIAVNVATLYREFGSSQGTQDPANAFALMAEIKKQRFS